MDGYLDARAIGSLVYDNAWSHLLTVAITDARDRSGDRHRVRRTGGGRAKVTGGKVQRK
jgi:hypothetical protein